MRWVSLGVLALAATACGSDQRSAAAGSADAGRCARATPATAYAICGKGPTGGRGPSTIERDGSVVARPIEDVGRWSNVFLSPDGETLLAQWSGACEIPTAYFVPTNGGRPRALTDYSKGSAISIAVGWQGSKARVRLPVGEGSARKPGIYVVDPATMAKTLVRRLPVAYGC